MHFFLGNIRIQQEDVVVELSFLLLLLPQLAHCDSKDSPFLAFFRLCSWYLMCFQAG